MAIVSASEPLPAGPSFPQACFPRGSPVFSEGRTFSSVEDSVYFLLGVCPPAIVNSSLDGSWPSVLSESSVPVISLYNLMMELITQQLQLAHFLSYSPPIY